MRLTSINVPTPLYCIMKAIARRDRIPFEQVISEALMDHALAEYGSINYANEVCYCDTRDEHELYTPGSS